MKRKWFTIQIQIFYTLHGNQKTRNIKHNSIRKRL